MPTAFRGKIRISCGRDFCTVDAIRENVQATCAGCPDAINEILDLDDRVMAGFPAAGGRPSGNKKPPFEGHPSKKKGR